MGVTSDLERGRCLSALALERLDAGALKGLQLSRARAHLSSCPRCYRRSMEMDQEAAAFRRHPRASSARAAFGAAERRQRMRWSAMAAVAVAAGVAVVPASRLLRARPPAGATPLHARAVPPTYLEPRGGDAPVRLRQVSIRG